ncbi:hypothetical protein H6F74_27210 [Trichocoleus sp. FACHB-90]|uniref:hypothetical protein n=1 Tax=Cyanophyceae TaxID=3028117 RepID=UPI001682400F|nr:hypothetical protein [Trichocoleus sp. FACHB-90]MBD1929893.1 hypothetical protein [Trichocoleus sp. FACHB-90]
MTPWNLTQHWNFLFTAPKFIGEFRRSHEYLKKLNPPQERRVYQRNERSEYSNERPKVDEKLMTTTINLTYWSGLNSQRTFSNFASLPPIQAVILALRPTPQKKKPMSLKAMLICIDSNQIRRCVG